MMTVAGPNMCRDVLETETLKKLRNSTKKYDLLITEFFGTDCMLGFAHLFDIPSITLTTSVTLPWTASYIGFPDNPSYIPVYFVPFRCPMSLLERLFNTAAYVMLKIGYDVLSMIDSNVHARHFFGPGLPDLRDLAKNVSLFLVNSHFSVHISRPTVPNFVEVAGVHINENYTLSQYFQESLKTDLNGIIYLSFGSMLMTESFPVDKIRGLFEAFRKIPYKILWKANKERFPENLDFPSNIQFEPWMPQLGILCHPNVKVFVSHGGMMGTLEALHCGVPVLGIPVFADQMLNIQTNAAKGLATYVSYSNITEESISEALNSLLEDCRYNDVSIRGLLPILQNNLTLDAVKEMSLLECMHLIARAAGTEPCEAILNSEIAHHLKNTTKKYDLLITHYFGSNCMLGFAHLFSIPTVAVITSPSLPWISSAIGLPDNPSYIPNIFTSFLPKMSFTERIWNTIAYVLTKISFEIFSNTKSNIIAKRFFGSELPDLNDLARNISLVLVNSHFSINQARPAVPNFVEVSGLHINENSTLTKHFEKSLDTNEEGIIYLSFGSMVMTESFNKEVLRAFFNTFKNLPYKILWKASPEKFPRDLQPPSNIQFESWMPQMEIMCHPNVKLFISHGGMLGTSEAIYCGVPILGIPIFGDQVFNMRRYAEKEIAIEMPYKQINEETLTAAVKSLLFNPKYKHNMEKMSKLFKDRPTSALETAIYWVEYVIRHRGAPHLRSIAVDLPWYQYYLVDVIAAFISAIMFASFILYKLFGWILLKLYITCLYVKKSKEE
ncbi:UDP-glucosyltransferase [Holotrichia oblita]|uniref:UDP-glucosyltransferase n=1 Tax=Holotrichia oblita TaxID=644536 RepID=A0ACB9TPD5_HOLOL|nr:UDP-glucosyltransferase [Holotrichia oblita]